MRVKGVGAGYWRVVGEVEDLVVKAKELASAQCLERDLRDF
jgi:hypothetical protein